MGYREIYVHIPFCVSRCNYCDFLSFAASDDKVKDRYLEALLREIVLRADRSELIHSIYIGGGTPSVLAAEQLGLILQALAADFILSADCEITVEFNVATVDRDYLAKLRKLGVNRLSCGAQSFHDAELVAMGRRHKASDVVQAINWALDVGFENLSIDLIYGLPGQTLGDWQYNLRQATVLPVQHISLYGLQLDNNSYWGKLSAKGCLKGADEDLSADMFECAMDMLPQYGYKHYEIANFSKDGYESRHNCGYWQRLNYLGLGLGAAGCHNEVRMVNTCNLQQYCDSLLAGQLPKQDLEPLTRTETLAEAAFLALRTYEGLNVAALSKRYGENFAEYYQKQFFDLTEKGLLQYQNGVYRLTRRGVLLGNVVFAEFL